MNTLIALNDYAWEQIRQAIPSDTDLTRVAPGSGWPTLRDCLSHIVLAYDRWLPAISELKAQNLPGISDREFATIEDVEARRLAHRNNLERMLSAWSDDELAARREVDVDGDVMSYSRGELVAHLLLHERGHHGDVTTLFWQLGLSTETALEYRFALGERLA